MEASRDVELLRKRLTGLSEPCVKAVLLFGSRARGESAGRSDVDLLVLHEDSGIEDAVLRRRRLYGLLRESVGEEFDDITVVDMKLECFLKPKEIATLLLNIYWDAVVVYGRTGSVERFLKGVREKISESGLKRVRESF